MTTPIAEHELQCLMVDYLIGPALSIRPATEDASQQIFALETTTGSYLLYLYEPDAMPLFTSEAMRQLNGAKISPFKGRLAMIFKSPANSNNFLQSGAA